MCVRVCVCVARRYFLCRCVCLCVCVCVFVCVLQGGISCVGVCVCCKAVFPVKQVEIAEAGNLSV